jgi:cytochrome c biogenesis protein CcmG/thiol:disulfide interchange protein DsbE
MSADTDLLEPRRSRTARWSALGVGVIVVALLAVLATRDTAKDRAARSPLLGTVAPAFSGPSVVGDNTFSLADQRGRFVVLNFFASWCVPCAVEHPELLSFANAHADAGDAEVVSVVFQDELEDVKAFFAKRGGSWPVIDSDRTAVDYGVTGVPETFLIDPRGYVVAKWSRALKQRELEQVMKDAISEGSGTQAGSGS